jgi:hypothetical protein
MPPFILAGSYVLGTHSSIFSLINLFISLYFGIHEVFFFFFFLVICLFFQEQIYTYMILYTCTQVTM